MSMTISALARSSGVGVETVRYYQRRGLLATPERGEGIRRYDAADARRLGFIRGAQRAGFTLEQIGELLHLDAGQDRARARELASERIAALDAKIAEMQAARAALERLARQCHASDEGPCPIIAAFEG
ncbi:MerR family DNA-binding protein [Sphingobium sp. SA2]|jgi:MerR family mercuric resistance operon transcriptional regulator|uniref:MerR family transcriptional regulator n=1 Tax=unclassified Sphingobium TaxID=2611147 RepID=UPI0005013363|nr:MULTISPECIES: MerR family transcriptional regulator [unclassified Sphingobium]KFL44954.1 MerR-family transcriptional regulator [Sphingobium sp. ba1]MDT7535192.1 MerR family DNA-binding protein [Sphingobium sp. SA2]